MLLRSYVEHSLYSRAAGYFAAKHVVGGLRKPLQFTSLKNEADYRHAIHRSWDAGTEGSAWPTPSELFTPHYGEAIARSIVARHRRLYPDEPLQMVEIGAGRGTFTCDVLRYLEREEPSLYAGCRYLVVEISANLAAEQRARIAQMAGIDVAIAEGADAAAVSSSSSSPRVEVIHKDAMEWAEAIGPGALKGPWWFTMLEVLDNLGHDQLRVTAAPDGGTRCEELFVTEHDAEAYLQREVHMREETFDGGKFAKDTFKGGGSRGSIWLPSYRLLEDRTLSEVCELLDLADMDHLDDLRGEIATADGAPAAASLAYHAQMLLGGLMGGGGRAHGQSIEMCVPTSCWRLLRALCAAAPEHQFTIADFSWLPSQPNGVINAPVVQMQKAGATIDLHGEYLRATGEVDILFPTNFAHLAHLIHAASAMSDGGGSEAKAIQNVTSAEFMRQWHDLEATRTQDGFNPLVDDFTNTRFVVTG